jgi:hypothetical protein
VDTQPQSRSKALIGGALAAGLAMWLELNQLLNQQSWIRFRFAHDVHNLQSLAETGFMRYGPEAQPLLPDLIDHLF